LKRAKKIRIELEFDSFFVISELLSTLREAQKEQMKMEPSLGQAPSLELGPSLAPFFSFFLVNFAITLESKLKLGFKLKYY
jgi:hypothetical protein